MIQTQLRINIIDSLLQKMFAHHQVRYSIKNFYKDVGLSPHFTIRGFFKRMQRKHPKTTKIINLTTIVLLTTSLGLILIPGSIIPFQKQIKLFIFRKVNSFDEFWYMSSFNPDPLKYFSLLNRNLTLAWSNKILDPGDISGILSSQNDILTSENIVCTNSLRIQAIFNYVDLLQKMLSDSFRQHFLEDPLIKQKYLQIIDIAVMRIKNQEKVTNDSKPMYLLSFKIFEYLLKLSSQQQDQISILQKLQYFLKVDQSIDFPDWYIPKQFTQEEGLKNQFRHLVFQNKPEITKLINRILIQVDKTIQKQK